MQRIREGLKTRIHSLVTQRTGLDEMAVDDLATSTKLQSWGSGFSRGTRRKHIGFPHPREGGGHAE